MKTEASLKTKLGKYGEPEVFEEAGRLYVKINGFVDTIENVTSVMSIIDEYNNDYWDIEEYDSEDGYFHCILNSE